MIENKAIIDKPKRSVNKISNKRQSSANSFEATAYVPRFWQGLFNVSRLMLFLVITVLIFWFTVGSDLYFNYQRSAFETEDIGAFYADNQQEFQQIYTFSSQRSQKLSSLNIDKQSNEMKMRIEDENMPKTPRPAMIFQLSNNRWKSEDYEKIEGGKLIYHRDHREKVIDRNWVYDFTVSSNEEVQTDVLTYLNSDKSELTAVESSINTIGLSFEIFPDSIMSDMTFQKFGNYKLMYSQGNIDPEEWQEIDQFVYIKHIPKKWEVD